jgi:hypothetical protein
MGADEADKSPAEDATVATLVALLASKDAELAEMRAKLEAAEAERDEAVRVADSMAATAREAMALRDQSSVVLASSTQGTPQPAQRPAAASARDPRDPDASSPRPTHEAHFVHDCSAIPTGRPDLSTTMSLHTAVETARARVQQRRRKNSPGPGLKEGQPGPEYILDQGGFRPQSSAAPRFIEGGRNTFTHVPERTPTSAGPPAQALMSPKDQVRLFGYVHRDSAPGPSNYSPMISKRSPQRAPGRYESPVGRPVRHAPPLS